MEGITHNLYAIKLLNKRLSDVKDTATGTITTVALQVLFLVNNICFPELLQTSTNKLKLLFEDCDAILAHISALEGLVNLRGGLGSFESNPQLLLLINLYVTRGTNATVTNKAAEPIICRRLSLYWKSASLTLSPKQS